jgi:hypothetical protein
MIMITLWSLLMKNYLIYKEFDDHDNPLEPLDDLQHDVLVHSLRQEHHPAAQHARFA